MEFCCYIILLIVLIILHNGLCINDTFITCEPAKEGSTTNIRIIKPKGSDIIISKSQPREEIMVTCKNICKKENVLILHSTVTKSTLNNTYDNVTLAIPDTTKAKVDGIWTLEDLATNHVYKTSCTVFETVKEIMCRNETVPGGLDINCNATNVSHSSKCYYELKINGIHQEARRPIIKVTEHQLAEIKKFTIICTLHIPKTLLTSGVYDVSVTFYPVDNGSHYILLGTKKLFTFQQVVPETQLINCQDTVSERNNVTCLCFNKTKANSFSRYYENETSMDVTAISGGYWNSFWFGLCIGLASETTVISACVSVYCVRQRIITRDRRRRAKSHTYDQLNLGKLPHRDNMLNANYQKFYCDKGNSRGVNQGSVYDEADT